VHAFLVEVKHDHNQFDTQHRARRTLHDCWAPPIGALVIQVSSAPKVVDDDEFETKLAAIIERDYFPDIKRLQNKLEWTQATESGDADRIANAQRNIVLRRAGFSVRPLHPSFAYPVSSPADSIRGVTDTKLHVI
jgi:Nuclear protein Es2